MRIIIVLGKYGGFCNRLFQSLHFHAYALDNGIKIFNPTMLGLLKYDNNFFYFLDSLNNLLLGFLTKYVKFFYKKKEIYFYFNKNNFIKICEGWNFRDYKSTIIYNKKLSKIYSFKSDYLSIKSKRIIKDLDKLKKQGKFLVGLHIRKGDYKSWEEGKFYFSDDFYYKAVNNIKLSLQKENRDPYIVAVSDEKIGLREGIDFIVNGSWKDDQLALQKCDLILGPPSTFTMWASYISRIPLIQLSTDKEPELINQKICKG